MVKRGTARVGAMTGGSSFRTVVVFVISLIAFSLVVMALVIVLGVPAASECAR
jgi:hypothetical protein